MPKNQRVSDLRRLNRLWIGAAGPGHEMLPHGHCGAASPGSSRR
jgi:hypothetical protein